ncbi:MAG TPA: ABC transporter substrate-binding protein [Bacillota bacterium]|jgi:iron(III) transport system substrate-binding protein|nr:ABC transporter substrate-binding protein [Bacillota bacterium]HPZ92724.1 ABC transporter substrate-binding protein [Bacillota bacterium]HQE03894.1 ABC transporter substrate-binding protein [Bacillota bacterium]
MKKLILGLIVLLTFVVCQNAFAANEVVVYTALQESDMVPLAKAFEEATGIKMDYVIVGGAGQVQARILAESKNPQADIFLGGSAEMHAPLAQDGLLVQYRSPRADELDEIFNDPEGYWQGWYMGVLGYVLNTERFEKEMAPKGVKKPTTWDDCLDPVWKGLYVHSNPSTAGGAYIHLCNQIFRLGEDAAWEYFKKLDEIVHHYTPGAPGPISACATGEFILGMSWAHDIVKTMREGYPIEVIIPEYTAFEIGAVSIVKGGPNTENAKKLVDWLLAKEAGELNTRNSYRYSARVDVTPPEGMPSLADVVLVDYDRDWALNNRAEVVKKWETIIQ